MQKLKFIEVNSHRNELSLHLQLDFDYNSKQIQSIHSYLRFFRKQLSKSL